VERIQFAYADSACVVATLDNVCVAIWKGECTMARSNEWIRASHVIAGRLGTPVAVISIITEHAPSPSFDVRAAQGRFVEDLSRTAVAAGAIVDGTGFRASFVRAVVAGVTGLARYRCPFKVTATDAEMAAWLDSRFATLPAGAVRPTARELRTLFADVREHLHGQQRAVV
jgi:hypothetical protein